MSTEYLKSAVPRTPAQDDATVRTVADILAAVASGREAAAQRYARELDGHTGEIVIGAPALQAASGQLSQGVRDDIAFAHARVRDFAQRQRDALLEFSAEDVDGLVTGQKLVPVNTAGCYVPGGRYAHAASAIMSVCTARTAGVGHIVATTPAARDQGVHPAILHALRISGADTVLALGGAQGIGALALGLFSGRPADVVVGPGNRFVAEAKRQVFGRVGIDVIAGPTESAIIADDSADPDFVAADLIGQAEHGVDSPVWLFTTSRSLAEAVLRRVPMLIASLPASARLAATQAWHECAEIVLCDSREAACEVSDRYAPEHLQVMARDLDWWLAKLTNYGSLFLGEETTVAFGDKCAGPNHILPTQGAARYTGGLSVGKFIKTLTWQRMTRAGDRTVAPVAARISRLEGMEGHARTADLRLRKYYPAEAFDLGTPLSEHS